MFDYYYEVKIMLEIINKCYLLDFIVIFRYNFIEI